MSRSGILTAQPLLVPGRLRSPICMSDRHRCLGSGPNTNANANSSRPYGASLGLVLVCTILVNHPAPRFLQESCSHGLLGVLWLVHSTGIIALYWSAACSIRACLIRDVSSICTISFGPVSPCFTRTQCRLLPSRHTCYLMSKRSTIFEAVARAYTPQPTYCEAGPEHVLLQVLSRSIL